jgi:uncharacterized alpha/beta hydrolase family protein
MIEEIDESLFISRFEDYKRVVTPENKNGNFTYKGLRALFNYLESYEEDTNEKINLDVIALCCEYNEYSDLDEYLKNYSNTHEAKTEEETEEEFIKRIEEEINDKTTLIKFENDINEGFIIAGY